MVDGPRARIVLLSAGALGLLVAVVVTAVVLLPRRTIRVPELVGVSRAQAESRVEALGLRLRVRDTRFSSTVPKDAVASQDPTSGVLLAPGADVTVDISAGSDSFSLPDVLGQDLDAARESLRTRGLIVVFSTAVSDVSSGTVIASAPTPGSAVATGDTIRLTVAADASAVPAADLTGVAFVFDPAPPPDPAEPDVGMDVATRVSALVTAAGATVTMTRISGVTSLAVTPAARTLLAKEASATALLGFSLAPSSLEGMVLMIMPPAGSLPEVLARSGPLADVMFASLAPDVSLISTITASGDMVLTGSGLPGLRIRLGSFASDSDARSFADVRWLDIVASDIYRALAQIYGRQ